MKLLAPLILCCSMLIGVAAARAGELRTYETKYYIIHTDLTADEAREATVRMTRMAEEYYHRTQDFAGAITQRMPFFLYKHAEDYYATGAPRGTAGYFNGTELVAVAEDMGPRTWNTVQHEGFHQFAHLVIHGDLPVWLDEGLAEYFGEAQFTGDGFIVGLIPQWRLKRIHQTLSEGQFRPIDAMMKLSHEQWNSDVAITNYDQGWSMVQFLAHGDGEKYKGTFVKLLGAIGQGTTWRRAWEESFGTTDGFDTRWRDYWINLPDNPTLDLYLQANVATLTSFWARAMSQQQRLNSFEAFQKAAELGQLKANPQDWLPGSFLADALKQAEVFRKAGYKYAIQITPGERPRLVCTLPDGRQMVGIFTLANARISTVSADLQVKKTSAH